MNKKVLLMILDGWGIAKNTKVSAIDHSKTPYINSLYKKYPHSKLEASGLAVGLPAGAPGFPHSAINFAAGMLRVPVGRFAAASACGMAVKGTIYVSAIHQATKVAALDQAISWRTAATLSGLALVLVALPPLLRFARGRVGVDGAPVEPA